MIAKLLYITFKTTQVNYLGFDFSFFFLFIGKFAFLREETTV